jgi:hypothetical protein
MKRVVLLRFVKDCYNKVINAEDLFPCPVLDLYEGHTLYAPSGTWWNRCQRNFKPDAVDRTAAVHFESRTRNEIENI